MAFKKKIITEDILIEYNHKNGFIKLIKEESACICRYGLMLKKRSINYKIQYSANGLNWSTASSYPKQTKNKMYQHFNEACNSLENGIIIKSLDLFCNQVKKFT